MVRRSSRAAHSLIPALALALLAAQGSVTAAVQSDNDERTGFGLHPDSLAFGRVAVGSGRVLSFKLSNRGNLPLEAVIHRCFETSREYRYSPLSIITLDPGSDATITVTYSPMNLGNDKGCLDVKLPDKGESVEVVALDGDGVQKLEEQVDLDLESFDVTGRVHVDRDQLIKIRMELSSPGGSGGARTVTVTGLQNSEVVYSEHLQAAGPRRSSGIRKVRFPDYSPPAGGDIL